MISTKERRSPRSLWVFIHTSTTNKFSVTGWTAPVNPLYHEFKGFLIDNTLKHLYPDAERTLIRLHKVRVKPSFVTDGSDEVEDVMLRTILERCKINPDVCIITNTRAGGRKKTAGRSTYW